VKAIIKGRLGESFRRFLTGESRARCGDARLHERYPQYGLICTRAIPRWIISPPSRRTACAHPRRSFGRCLTARGGSRTRATPVALANLGPARTGSMQIDPPRQPQNVLSRAVGIVTDFMQQPLEGRRSLPGATCGRRARTAARAPGTMRVGFRAGQTPQARVVANIVITGIIAPSCRYCPVSRGDESAW